ncbi:unnamed protein product [marine sediment metagenome]|uniref:Uncharacterized protein n=1 Tax=marine sediment metagenome TaxID=412755 RepID=X0WT27_9ZZZZ
MLLLTEDRCPECKKQLYLIFKMGGGDILVTIVNKKDYKKLIDTSKLTDKVWTDIVKKALR